MSEVDLISLKYFFEEGYGSRIEDHDWTKIVIEIQEVGIPLSEKFVTCIGLLKSCNFNRRLMRDCKKAVEFLVRRNENMSLDLKSYFYYLCFPHYIDLNKQWRFFKRWLRTISNDLDIKLEVSEELVNLYISFKLVRPSTPFSSSVFKKIVSFESQFDEKDILSMTELIGYLQSTTQLTEKKIKFLIYQKFLHPEEYSKNTFFCHSDAFCMACYVYGYKKAFAIT